MKRFLLWLVAGFFLFVYVASNNTFWMKSWVETRGTHAAWLPPEGFLYGDLYSFTHQPEFRLRKFVAEDVRPAPAPARPRVGVDLYSICDSYLYEALPDAALLPHADHYRFTRWEFEAKRFRLDPAQRNVLLLETVERHVRSIFPDTAHVFRHLDVAVPPAPETVDDVVPLPWADKQFFTRVFNRNIEQNLEYNLFDYPVFTPLRELKAELNRRVFGRPNAQVVASATRPQLYYGPTVDTATVASSFRPLPAAEEERLVANFNAIYHHYRRLGFAEVYLAIMPNPVTVLEPNLQGRRYNNLIPRLQHNPRLQMPVLDMYGRLRAFRGQSPFEASDTHWNKAGFLAGIALIDSALATQVPAAALARQR